MTATSLAVTPPYAAALAILLVVLSVRVIAVRRRDHVGFGDAGNPDLVRRVRVQANFAEYAPVGLLLLALAELRGAPDVWLHATGALLLIGRLVHAVGVSRPETDGVGRVAGTTGTLFAVLLAAILLAVPS